MPITRRKRANPPDQPENNNHNAEQTENAVEALASAQAPTGPVEGDNAGIGTPTPEQAAPPATSTTPPPVAPVVPPVAPIAPIGVSNGAEQINNIRHLSRVAVVPPVVSFSGVRHSRHRQCNHRLCRHKPLRRHLCSPQRMKSRCHWGICCTWPITLVILAQMKLAAHCCINLRLRVRRGAGHAVGIVARLRLSMIAGARGARHSAKWALLSVKFAAYGVFSSLLIICDVVMFITEESAAC